MAHNGNELIEVRLHRSRYMMVVGAFIHTLALLGPWFSSLFLPLQLLISLLVIVHGWLFYHRHINFKSPLSVLALRYHNDQWLLQTAGGWQRVWVSGSILVTPWLMAFRFRTDSPNKVLRRIYPVCLWSDSDKAESLHGLRLRLLLQKQENNAPSLLFDCPFGKIFSWFGNASLHCFGIYEWGLPIIGLCSLNQLNR